MTDILGPGTAAPNAVTTRVASYRAFGTVDTWFKDCSTPVSQDGTAFQADFFNGVIGQLRAAVRGNGKKIDGVTPIVVEDNTNDAMLLGAILQLIQRGQATYAPDTGTADALVVAPTPAVVEYKPGLRLVVLKNPLVNANATTTPKLDAGLGAATIVKSDGSALGIGDLKKGGVFEVEFDGAGNARLLSLTAPSDVLASLLITTAITKVVGGAGADFPDLTTAFAWLSQYRITSTGSVTFACAAGKFIYSSNVTFDHSDGRRVSIVGRPLTGGLGAVTTTGYSAAQRASDHAANLAAVRANYQTELSFTGGTGFFGYSKIGNIQDILFTGDGTTTSGAGDLLSLNGANGTITRVAAFGGAGRQIVVTAGSLGVSGQCLTSGGTIGLSSEEGGSVFVAGQIVGLSASAAGIQSINSSNIACVPNTSASIVAQGCAGYGQLANGSSRISNNAPSSVSYCANGFAAVTSSSVTASGCSATNCGTAFQAGNGGSFIDATNTTGSVNTLVFYAFNGGDVVRSGTSCIGTTTSSPAVGTVGNSNSLVS